MWSIRRSPGSISSMQYDPKWKHWIGKIFKNQEKARYDSGLIMYIVATLPPILIRFCRFRESGRFPIRSIFAPNFSTKNVFMFNEIHWTRDKFLNNPISSMSFWNGKRIWMHFCFFSKKNLAYYIWHNQIDIFFEIFSTGYCFAQIGTYFWIFISCWGFWVNFILFFTKFPDRK